MANTYTDFVTGSIIAPTELSYAKLQLTSNVVLYWPAYTPPATVSGGLPMVAAAKLFDVTPSGATVFSIALPQGNLGSVGQTIEFTNRGATPFIVTDSAGSNSTNVGAGASVVFYLSDNSTIVGTWRTLQLGVGTGSADANALAGAGLVSLDGKLNQQITVVEILSAPVLTEAQRATAFVWRGGSSIITLPQMSSLSANWFCIFRNQGTGTITINPFDASSSINQTQSLPLNVGQSCFLLAESSANRWYSVGNVTASFNWTSATYSVDAIPVNTLNLTAGAPIIQRYIAPTGSRTQALAVTYPATPSLYVVVNNTSASYNITFTVAGSAQTPISIPTNTQAFLASDGVNLFLLSSQLIGAIQLNQGSPSSPTLTYLLDTLTGLYQPNLSQLGVTVGGQSIATFNGSDPSNLIISSPATAIFARIDGGAI